MKKNHDEEYYASKTIAELKKEALRRNLAVPHPSTKNYLIYILTHSADNQQQPVNGNLSDSYNATSDDDLSANNKNRKNHSNKNLYASRNSPNHSPLPPFPTNTDNYSRFSQNRQEEKREMSPILPKQNKTKNKQNHKKEKKKKSFFDMKKIENMFSFTENLTFNDFINYSLLLCIFIFGFFDPTYIILFSVFLFDLISTNHIKCNSFKYETKRRIRKYIKWIYLLICIRFPLSALFAILSIYVGIKISQSSFKEFDIFILVFYFSFCLVCGASPLVVLMFKQHLRNTNSDLVERIFNIH